MAGEGKQSERKRAVPDNFCGEDEPETKRRRSESNSDNADDSAVPKRHLEEEKKEDEPIKLSEDIEIQASVKKDGVLKGKASYTIDRMRRRPTFNIIQIMCADFKVQLHGTRESIRWAEKLVKVFVDKVNAGGSFVNPDFISLLAAGGGEQHEIQNGFEKAGDLLNKALYTILWLEFDWPYPTIQIMMDAPDVILHGTSTSIMWVVWLIKEVNAEAAASPSLVDRLFGAAESASDGEDNEHGSSSSIMSSSPPSKDDRVLKGKACYTIDRLPRRQKFYRIQVMCADFKVELAGTMGSIMWAEKLVKVFVDKVNAGGSFVNPEFISVLAASGGEQPETEEGFETVNAGGSFVNPEFISVLAASGGEQPETEEGFETVGNLLNKATYTIRSLWANSQCPNIEIMIDADKVLLCGTAESIMWVGWLIKEVNAEAATLPSLVHTLFGTVESASGGEQHKIRDPVKEHGSSSLIMPKEDALKVDDYTYLVIDRKGGYSLSDKPQEIPLGYYAHQFTPVPELMVGLRIFQVYKYGRATYDIVRVGVLNVINSVAWIAGETVGYEGEGFTLHPPVCIPPFALSFPCHMTPDEYMTSHWDKYVEMLQDKLARAMLTSGYDPDDYGVDEALCLRLMNQSVDEPRNIFPHRCHHCHDSCSVFDGICVNCNKRADEFPEGIAYLKRYPEEEEEEEEEEEKKEDEPKKESEPQLEALGVPEPDDD